MQLPQAYRFSLSHAFIVDRLIMWQRTVVLWLQPATAVARKHIFLPHIVQPVVPKTDWKKPGLKKSDIYLMQHIRAVYIDALLSTIGVNELKQSLLTFPPAGKVLWTGKRLVNLEKSWDGSQCMHCCICHDNLRQYLQIKFSKRHSQEVQSRSSNLLWLEMAQLSLGKKLAATAPPWSEQHQWYIKA